MHKSVAEPLLLESAARLGMVLGNTGFDFTGAPNRGPSDADLCACFRKFTHGPLLHAGLTFATPDEWRDVFVVELELDHLCRLHEKAGTLDWKYEVTLSLYDRRTSLLGFLPTIRLPNDHRIYVHGAHVRQVVDHLSNNPDALTRVLAARVQAFVRPPPAPFPFEEPARPTTLTDVMQAFAAFPGYRVRVLRELRERFGRNIEKVPPLELDEYVAGRLRIPVSLRGGWLAPSATLEYAAAIAGAAVGDCFNLPRVNVMLSGLDRSMHGATWSTFINVALNSLPQPRDDAGTFAAMEEDGESVSVVLGGMIANAMTQRLDRHDFVFLKRKATGRVSNLGH